MAQNGFQSFVARLLGSTSGPNAALNLNAKGSLIVVTEATEQGAKYVSCPLSATTALGTGAIGDTLQMLTIIPTVAAAGVVQIKDGANSAITVFVGGGTTALNNLLPVTIFLEAPSVAGGWSVICGAGVTAIASGEFTP